MWRAFFLALGTSAFILGAECLLIDKAVLRSAHDASGEFAGSEEPGGQREVVPPDWAPWSLMSAGAVTILYSFSIPKRVKSA